MKNDLHRSLGESELVVAFFPYPGALATMAGAAGDVDNLRGAAFDGLLKIERRNKKLAPTLGAFPLARADVLFSEAHKRLVYRHLW